MKPIAMLGVLLIIAGVAGLFISHFDYSETKPILKAGPLEVDTQETHTVWIPMAASVAAMVAGAGLIVAGRRN